MRDDRCVAEIAVSGVFVNFRAVRNAETGKGSPLRSRKIRNENGRGESAEVNELKITVPMQPARR